MSLPPPPSREKLPVNNGWAEMPRTWIKWFTDLANASAASVAVTWASISKSGSSLADLETRNHSSLQNLNTADYAHLYLADRDSLVGGSDSVLHYHDTDRDSDNFFGTEWTDLTDAGVTTLHQHDFNYIPYPASLQINSPTHIDNLQEITNHQWSAGVLHGCDFTNNGDGTANLSSGFAALRATADAHTSLYMIGVNAQTGITFTDNATNYLYLDYASGTPQFAVSTSITSFNCMDKCIAYVVHRDGTTLHWIDAREQNVDGNRKMRQLFLKFARFIHAEGGTILGASGLAITVTSGSFYFMLQELAHDAFDTTVAGTANVNVFTLWYRDGVGGWTETANQKTITTTTYDSNTGTPATLGNNKYGVTWFYIVNDSPSELHAIMGQAEYASLADARVATVPASLPTIISGLASLIGFVVYEKSAVAFADVRSAFSSVFVSSTATTHNGLSGLQGGDVNEYYHLTSAEYTGTGTGVFVRATGAAINPTTTGATTPGSGKFTTVETTSTAMVGGGAPVTYGGMIVGNGVLTLTGLTTMSGITSNCVFDSATTTCNAYTGRIFANGATLTDARNFSITGNPTLSGGATITNLYGYFCPNLTTTTTATYGYYSNIASASGRWNFYAAGTANNAFNGNSRFGGVTAPTVAVDVTGAVLATTSILSSGATSGIGYTTGAGGTVTQATSRTTGVTLNKVTGQITLVSAAGSATPATFTVTNSAVAATDNIIIQQSSGTDLYQAHVTRIAAGAFDVTFWTTGGTTTEQPVFNFTVIKGVNA